MADLQHRESGHWRDLGQGVPVVPPSDTTPPTAPSALHTTAVTNTTVTLAWTAATDNVGVAGYEVSKNDLATTPISGPGLTHLDSSGVAATTYRFKVRAYDAAGNRGPFTSNLTVTTTGTPPPPPSPAAFLGMNAPDGLWNTRYSEVTARGGASHFKARRIFFGSLTDNQWGIVDDAIAAGQNPVLSWKPGDWGSAAAGTFDTNFNAIKTQLANRAAVCAANGLVIFCVLHHEPGAVGHPPKADVTSNLPSEFAPMYLHAGPILRSAGAHIRLGTIMNGWMFIGTAASGPNTNTGNGYTDAELAQWLPQSMLDLCDFHAADHYQITQAGAHPLRQMQRHQEWAHRVGAKGTGTGEFNDFTAQGITDLCNVAKNEPLCRFHCHWNNTASAAGILDNTNGGGKITGANQLRLQAFQDELISWPVS